MNTFTGISQASCNSMTGLATIRLLSRSFCAITVAISVSLSAQAATYTWSSAIGVGTTDWNTAANWGGVGYPGSVGTVDLAVLPDSTGLNATVDVSAPVSINQLKFDGAAAIGYNITGQSITLNNVGVGSASAVYWVSNSGGTNTINADLILNAAEGAKQGFGFNGTSGMMIFNGVISSTHNLADVTFTFGQFTLTGNNTYTGDSYLNGGNSSVTITHLGNAGASGNLGAGTSFGGYGTVKYQGAGETSSKAVGFNQTGSRAVTLDTTDASGGLVLTGNMTVTVVGNNTLALQGDNTATNEFRGKIIDGNGITLVTKYGTGTWRLSGTNTYSGANTLGAGSLILGNRAALGTGLVNMKGVTDISADTDLSGVNAVANTLYLSKPSPTFSGSNSIEFCGSVTNTQTSQYIPNELASGSLTFSGNVFLSDLNTSSRGVTFNGSGASTVSGNIANNGGANTLASNLAYAGTGTLTLSGNNTYSGVTTLSSGVLLLSSANALPGSIGNSGGTSGLKINGGVVGLGNGDFSRGLGNAVHQVQFAAPGGGFAAYGADRVVNLGGASAGVTFNTGSFVATGSTLIFGAPTATHTVDFQNPLALVTAVRTVQVDDGSAVVDAKLSGALTGTGVSGLIKTGPGTLALTAANTYTGDTTVNAGRLLVNGTTTGQGNFIVNADATLGGTGSVGLASGKTATINAGGMIAPGFAGVGTLTVGGNFILAENANCNLEYKDGGNGSVLVTGDLQLPSVATVTVSQVSGAMPEQAILFSAGSLSGSGASDLSGWVVTKGYAAKKRGTDVVVYAYNPETVIIIR